MIDELIAWLLPLIDEDERVASAVTAPKWSRYLEGGGDGWAIESEPPGCDFIVGDAAAAKHVADHDPARVLRQVEAMRLIIGQYEAARAIASTPDSPASCAATALADAVRAVALVYADRPGFREAWRS